MLTVEQRWEAMALYDSKPAEWFDAAAIRQRASGRGRGLDNAEYFARLADAKRLGVPYPDYRGTRVSAGGSA